MMVITCGAYFTVILNFEMPVISDTHQTFCVHSFIIMTAYTPNFIKARGCKVEDGVCVGLT